MKSTRKARKGKIDLCGAGMVGEWRKINLGTRRIINQGGGRGGGRGIINLGGERGNDLGGNEANEMDDNQPGRGTRNLGGDEAWRRSQPMRIAKGG
jgi:hypothetical protein